MDCAAAMEFAEALKVFLGFAGIALIVWAMSKL